VNEKRSSQYREGQERSGEVPGEKRVVSTKRGKKKRRQREKKVTARGGEFVPRIRNAGDKRTEREG